MKANELRIGNYVWDSYSGEMIISQITYSNESVFFRKTWLLPDGFARCQDIEPIPLTEEWLLKFGFRQQGYLTFLGDSYPRYIIGRNGAYTLDEKVYIYEVNEHDLCEIHYVHQLQNLYFALTGEELNTNQ